MPRKTKEELEEEVELGEREEDPYTEEGRGSAIDDDSLTDVDEGFMKGYEEDSLMTKCVNCGAILEEDIIEEEFDGDVYRFCSEDCATEFERKRKKKST